MLNSEQASVFVEWGIRVITCSLMFVRTLEAERKKSYYSKRIIYFDACYRRLIGNSNLLANFDSRWIGWVFDTIFFYFVWSVRYDSIGVLPLNEPFTVIFADKPFWCWLCFSCINVTSAISFWLFDEFTTSGSEIDKSPSVTEFITVEGPREHARLQVIKHGDIRLRVC